MKYFSMLSGGQDSTCATFKIIEMGWPLDAVIFTDTEHEFNEMYEYLDKVEERLKESGVPLVRTKHKRGEKFTDWVFGRVKSGKRKGMIRGLPMVTQPCYWKRESKVYPFDNYLKENNITDYVQYIGYTYSEKERANVKDKHQRFPLIELKMCEADVAAYLESIDLVNPLYQWFERTGCAMCPYQKERGFFIIWKKYPEWWAWMKDIEHKLFAIEDSGQSVVNPQWAIRYTMDEYEDAFKTGKRLHEVEAPKACECGT